MPLDIPRFRIAIARGDVGLTEALELGEGDGYDVHEVAILHADTIVAEQAGPRYGLPVDPADAKLGYTTLWCWCALTRDGVDVLEFPKFKARVLSIDPVDPPAEQLDPTADIRWEADTN